MQKNRLEAFSDGVVAILITIMVLDNDGNPDVIASGNPGCLMQLRAGVTENGLRAQVLHPITLLDRAYGGRGRSGQAPYL